jgi:hypothetical protein
VIQIHLDGWPLTQGAQDDVAPGVFASLLARKHTGLHLGGHPGVIARDLLEALPAHDVRARVSDVGEHERVT